MFKFLTVLCLIIASVSQISAERGINAKEGEFKYQAILYYKSLYRPIPVCGGAIVNEYYVLSSAYCVHQFIDKYDTFVTYVGTTSLYMKQQKRQIAEIKIPREFVVSEKHHDIALIRLTEKIEYTQNIQPISLPTSDVVPDVTFRSSGFGIREHPQHIMETMHRSDQLHYHETSVVPMDECKAIYEESRHYKLNKENLGNGFICTKNVDGFDFTYSDEGNPLVANNILYGLASWAFGSKDYPNVYTKVYAHKQWIENNMN